MKRTLVYGGREYELAENDPRVDEVLQGTWDTIERGPRGAVVVREFPLADGRLLRAAIGPHTTIAVIDGTEAKPTGRVW